MDEIQRSCSREKEVRKARSIVWVIHPDATEMIAALGMLIHTKFIDNYEELIAAMKLDGSTSCKIGMVGKDELRASFHLPDKDLYKLTPPKDIPLSNGVYTIADIV